MRCLVLAALAACYSPHYTNCTISCESGAGCPAGYTCDGHLCQANGSPACGDGGTVPDAFRACNVAADPTGDCDNDTIRNDMDNCPSVANVDQDNEDGDKWGDACDKCPPFATAADDDSDGDGVGDACDPNPSTPGDKIELFENFMNGGPQAHSGMQPVFFGAPGDWSFQALQQGTATVTMGPVIKYDELAWMLPTGFPHKLTLTTRVALIAPTNTGSFPNLAGLSVAYQTGNLTRWDCTLGPHVSGPSQLGLSIIDGGGNESNDLNVGDGAMSSILLFTIDGAGYCLCSDPPNGLATDTISCTVSYDHLGLAAREETAQYFWFMVVSSP